MTLFGPGSRKELASGLEKNIFVEFIDIPHKDPALIERVVDRAVLSQVDGIAFQPYDVEISSNAVAKTMEAGIATIVYETDVYYIPDVPTSRLKQLRNRVYSR